MPTTTTRANLGLPDLLRLGSLDEHPRVHAAHARVTDAQRTCESAERRHAEAQTERHAAESAAADGQRDERRLTRAQAQMDSAASELRIATVALERARTAATETYDDVCRDIDNELRAHHRPALRDLDTALAEAKRCSDAVARIEDASRVLLSGGYYRKEPGTALTEGCWRREFGGPTSRGETRYSYWRKFWKLG